MKKEPRPNGFTFRRLMVRALLLCTGRVTPTVEPPELQNKILILAQEKLGDAILLTPLPRLIKKARPETEIHVVTFGKNKEFFKADPHIDQVYAIKGSDRDSFHTLRQQHYDVLINTKDHPSFSFLFLTRLVRAKWKISIYHPYHEGFFHHLIHIEFHRHVVEKNCALYAALGIPLENADCRPRLPPVPASATIRDFTTRLVSFPAPRIGINLSAGDSDREWPIDKWRDLLSRFFHGHFVVFSMPERRNDKRVIESNCTRCIPLPQTTTIFDVAEILKHIDLLITPDTSLIHVCSCLNIPVVALFRSQKNHISHFSPYSVPNRIIVSQSMFVPDIPVTAVFDATTDLLAKTKPAEAKEK